MGLIPINSIPEMRRCRFNLYVLLCVVAAAVAVTSCHTTKKTTKPASPGKENVEHKKKPGRPAAKSVADALVSEAEGWLGVPYLWGGNTTSGVDCSGFLTAVYRDAVGIKLPRTTKLQKEYCLAVDNDRRAVGDILFFSSKKSRGKVAHVGMYIGNNKMIHSSSSRGVVIDDLSMRYYKEHFLGVGRPPLLAEANPVSHSKKPSKEKKPAEPQKDVFPQPEQQMCSDKPLPIVAPEVKNEEIATISQSTNSSVVAKVNPPAKPVVINEPLNVAVAMPDTVIVTNSDIITDKLPESTTPATVVKAATEKASSPTSIVKNAFATRSKNNNNK